MTASQLRGQLLRWPVERTARSFRVFVVEPSELRPDQHPAIFSATLEAFLTPSVEQNDPYRSDVGIGFQLFDLITFPEAFLATDVLKDILTRLSQQIERLGCIHVGLRSSQKPVSHLIGVAELMSLVDALLAINSVEKNDLAPIKEWIGTQKSDAQFNMGCVFSIDARAKLRVCLHPKMVRSKFEVGAVADTHMTEGNLLTLITLLPDSKRFLSVALQPIICSDALNLSTGVPGRLPLHAINNDGADVFAEPIPDHIDVISVATCTPQLVGQSGAGEYRKWHDQFCKTFSEIGDGGLLYRHFHATVVLANFLNVPTEPGALAHKSYGGLSGAFYPMPFTSGHFPNFAQLTAFGKFASEASNCWANPVGKYDTNFTSRGYIAHLKPIPNKTVVAKLFGFTITNFPRDTSHWNPGGGLVDFELKTALFDHENGSIVFQKEGEFDVAQ